MKKFLNLFPLILFLFCAVGGEALFAEGETDVDTASDVAIDDKKDEDTYKEKEVVVTATKTNVEEEKITRSVTIITEDEIDKSKSGTVAESLRSVPGVTLRNTGGIGHVTSVSVRGGQATQTLVMFDGVQSINSPTLGSADIADLFTTGIERIEVLRGGSGVLYGSSAQAGIVNIITKRGRGKPEIEAMAEFGTHRTFRETVGVSGSMLGEDLKVPVDEVYFAASGTRVDSDGIGIQNDYENWYFTDRAGVDINEHINLDFVNRVWMSETGLDTTDWQMNSVGETDHYQHNKMVTVKPQLNLNYGWWSASYSYSGLFQDYYAESRASQPYRTGVEIAVNKMDFLNTVTFPEYKGVKDKFTFGFDLSNEDASFRDFGGGEGRDKMVIQRGIYFQNEIELFERLILDGGVRFYDHSEYKHGQVFSASGAYLFPETGTKIKASFDQSYRSPTINDLFWPYSSSTWFGWTYVTQGNPNLKPEEGEHYEIGVDQKLFEDKVKLSASYFYSRYTDMIAWTSSTSGTTTTWQPTNINNASLRGVETDLVVKLNKYVDFCANYTYIDSKDKSDTRHGEEIYGVPNHSASIGTNIFLFDRLNINFDVTVVSKKVYSGAPYKVNSYCKGDLSVSYDITKDYQIYGRIENIFNDDYMEVAGYPMPHTMFYIGGKMKFGGEK